MKILFTTTATIGSLLLFYLNNEATSETFNSNLQSITSQELRLEATNGNSQNIVDLCNAFKATLTASQISSLEYEYSLNNAKKWSNLPASMSARIGLSFGSLNSDQLTAAKTLLEAMTVNVQNEGYEEVKQIMLADDYLSANGGGSTYGAGNYYISFLGTPSNDGTFEILFTGHHKTVANTYTNGALVGATPHFESSEPFAAFTYAGSPSYQPLLQERDALANMLNSLSSSQQSIAKLSTTFTDLLLAPGKDWVFPSTKSGIRVGDLNDDQKALTLEAIKTFVNDVDSNSATKIIAKYSSELDNTYISYSGNTSLTVQNDYVRIDGPSVWIEYSTQRGIVLKPTHPHAIWRDHLTDYAGTGNPTAIEDDNEYVKKINIYPNPVDDYSTFNFILNKNATVKISISDYLGNIISTPYQEKLSAGNNSIRLDLRNLKKGAYIYNIITNDKNISGKLLKN